MCNWCENGGETCQDCGSMICKDVMPSNSDDVISAPYVTESGDLFCTHCGSSHDRDTEEIYQEDDFGFYDPYDGFITGDM